MGFDPILKRKYSKLDKLENEKLKERERGLLYHILYIYIIQRERDRETERDRIVIIKCWHFNK